MNIANVLTISISSLIEMWKIRHEKVDYYVTVRPEEKDDNGFLGYKWRGLVYVMRDEKNAFIPLESCKLYLSPKEAIIETRQYYYNLLYLLGRDKL